MPKMSFNPFKSRDRYFLACKVATLLMCIPWPLTLVASVMSLAGQFRPGTPLLEVFLVRSGWLLALVYPAVFLLSLWFAEGVLAPRFYRLAAVVALLPLGLSLFVLLAVFAF